LNQVNHNEGLTLRLAALIAGFAYLLSPVTTAEFSIMPKLVIPGNIEPTVQNIVAHGGLFVAAILCYMVTFIEDVVIAWALYVLLAPVNRSLSLLTAWFRLVYTAIVLFGWLNLVTVFRLLHTPDYCSSGFRPDDGNSEIIRLRRKPSSRNRPFASSGLLSS
jgi:hypothetical protein